MSIETMQIIGQMPLGIIALVGTVPGLSNRIKIAFVSVGFIGLIIQIFCGIVALVSK